VRGQGFRAGGLAANEFVLGVGQLLQGGVPLGLQSPGDQPVVRVDGPVAALGPACLVAGLLDLPAPLRERGVVTILELLRGGQTGLQRGGLQRGQESGGHGGVDRDAADAQVPGAPAVDELAGAGAVVAGRGFGRAVVVDGELAAAGPAGGQPLQQRAALPDRAGARLVRPRAGVGADAGLVGLVGVPVDEPAMVLGDEYLPLALGQLAAAGAQHAILAEAAPLAGLAEHVGAGVGGVSEHVVHRVVGRLDPHDLLSAQVSGRLQRKAQTLLAQPQPHPAHRPGHREPVEDRGDDPGDGLVRVPADLPVGLAPHQPDRQPTAQLAAGGLVADPAVEAGTQDVQLGLGHGALHTQHQPVVE